MKENRMGNPLHSEFEHLFRIEKFIASMSDLDSLLAVIMREATLATESESCSIALYDEQADELHFCVARGEDEEREFERELKQVRLPMGQGVLGWCAQQRELVNIKDAYNDPRFNKEADRKTGFVTRSILAAPMMRPDKLVGVVEAVNKRDEGGFTEHDEQVLAVLAAQAALVIDNARLYEQNIQQARLAALGQGIAGAAHCIKNILHGVAGGEYILKAGVKREDMAKIGRGWDILSRNTGLMKEMVMDMLTYSRPREPEYEPCDINRICTQIADMMREKGGQQGVDVSVDFADDLGEVVCDSKGLYRCVLNLVGNAVDACGEAEGKVTLSTGKLTEENCFRVEVSDNGSGISKENLKQLFTPFFSTKGSKGTGLGLAVTHKIITEHGGDIRVESEPDVGTRFEIILPLCPPAQEEGDVTSGEAR
jgi:signal transduction histidine kinase